MTHEQRKRDFNGPPRILGEFYCGHCRKRSFLTRADAKRAARGAPTGDRLTAYRCPADDGYWHIGHLSAKVRSGVIDRAAFHAARDRRAGGAA